MCRPQNLSKISLNFKPNHIWLFFAHSYPLNLNFYYFIIFYFLFYIILFLLFYSFFSSSFLLFYFIFFLFFHFSLSYLVQPTPSYPHTSTSQDNPLHPLYFFPLIFLLFFSPFFFLHFSFYFLYIAKLLDSTPTWPHSYPISHFFNPLFYFIYCFSKAHQPFTLDVIITTANDVTLTPFSTTSFPFLILPCPQFLTSPIFLFYHSFYFIIFYLFISPFNSTTN